MSTNNIAFAFAMAVHAFTSEEKESHTSSRYYINEKNFKGKGLTPQTNQLGAPLPLASKSFYIHDFWLVQIILKWLTLLYFEQ